MASRRAFLAAAAALPAFRPDALRRVFDATPRGTTPAGLGGLVPTPVLPGTAGGPDDEDYWGEIQRAFDLDRSMVNLNNGGCSPAPTHVLEQMIRDLKFSNELPVIHMWQTLEPRLESVRRDLAATFGCDPEEMAITRNASEALETLIFGLDLARGDEVIVSTQNYGRMLTSWDQRVRRDGIVLKQVRFPVPPKSKDEILDAFKAAVTPRTRVIEFLHITNLSGQIMPVREMVEWARPRGIEVFVDGAHAFAQFPFTRDGLGCDYYGTSLHKWLLAPIGTGFLYVRKNKQKKIWPLMAAPATMDENIRKYEEIGTHPAANHNAIAVALAFHHAIGAERKAARLRYLRDRWARRVVAESGGRCRVLTPLEGEQACGIGLVHVEGMDPGRLVGWFMEKHKVVVTPIDIKDEFNGLRVTPNIYTTPREVDLLADLLLTAARQGISS